MGMSRGTRVAKAIVDVDVNGDGINDEITDSVAKAGPGVEKEGDRQGDRFGGRFGDSLKARLEKIAPRVSKALGERMNGAGLGNQMGDDAGTNFVDRMSEKVRGAGDKIAKELGDRMASRPEQVRRGVDRAFDDDFADRLGARFAEQFSSSLSLHIKKNESALGKALNGMVSGNRGGGAGGGKNGGFDIGRLFGAGSRSNSLNLFGKSIGNTVKLTTKLTRSAQSMFGTFTTGWKSAEKGATLAQRAMSGFGAVGTRMSGMVAKGMSSLAAAGPAAAVAIVAVVAAMSVMVSVAGALIGIVTALAATITSALVGGLAVAGGAMMALVAAGGLLTAAFMSMTDAQKTVLKEAFTPLRDMMTGIGQIMMEDMVPAFATWSANLQRAAMLTVPVARVMGSAFAEAGNRLTAAFSGPGFQAFAQAMTIYLPSIVTRMSSALGGFLNGTTGMFAALMPLVNQFAGWLDRVATKFSTWANSAEGQNSIVDFANRAVESLKRLWAFTGEFFGFLGDLLFSTEGQNAGNSMFDSMRKAFEKFRDAISSGDLERWFDDAATLGSALWEVMQSLYGVFEALYNSGVLEGVATGMSWLADMISLVGGLLAPLVDILGLVGDAFSSFDGAVSGVGDMFMSALGPIGTFINTLSEAASMYQWVKNLMGGGGGNGGISGFSLGSDISSMVNRAVGGAQKKIKDRSTGGGGGWTPDKVKDYGAAARAATSRGSGGTMASPSAARSSQPAKYENPYKDWAQSLIRMGPALRTEIRLAVRKLRREGVAGIRDAAKSMDHAGLATDLLGNVNDMRKGGVDLVKQAQNQVNTAARSLAGANSPGEAKAALKELKKAQKDLEYAQKQQKRLQKASDIINKQRYTNVARVKKLLSGQSVANATLADFALARESLAVKIEEANQKLADAIAMRDDYKAAVTDAAKAFGALTGAMAKTVGGVEQALTAGDITSHLQDRLGKIRKFQSDLQLLLASGLSDAAYKQIVDAGVDGGAAYAEALLAGGIGAVGEVNNLVSQIGSASDALGKETSDRLYQAGVDAAQGLLDGLTKLDDQLERAAFVLGEKIAKQVKRALGIKSPSTVMIGAMDDVGDGTVIGLDNQSDKIIKAADRFSRNIMISPDVALADARARIATVSGNQPVAGDISLTVVTPTKDPVAAAHEAVNELVGRLN